MPLYDFRRGLAPGVGPEIFESGGGGVTHIRRSNSFKNVNLACDKTIIILCIFKKIFKHDLRGAHPPEIRRLLEVRPIRINILP
jgi:hypothetical protein